MLYVGVKIEVKEVQIFMEKMNSVDSNMNNILILYVTRQTRHPWAFRNHNNTVRRIHVQPENTDEIENRTEGCNVCETGTTVLEQCGRSGWDGVGSVTTYQLPKLLSSHLFSSDFSADHTVNHLESGDSRMTCHVTRTTRVWPQWLMGQHAQPVSIYFYFILVILPTICASYITSWIFFWPAIRWPDHMWFNFGLCFQMCEIHKDYTEMIISVKCDVFPHMF